MTRLTDENPYRILGITPTANRNAIRNAFAKRNAERLSGDQRRKVHQSYETLRSPDDRAAVDTLVPLGDSGADPHQLLSEVEAAIAARESLLSLLDLEAIWQHDYHQLIQSTIQALCLPGPEPSVEVPWVPDFDSLDEFVAEFGT